MLVQSFTIKFREGRGWAKESKGLGEAAHRPCPAAECLFLHPAC